MAFEGIHGDPVGSILVLNVECMVETGLGLAHLAESVVPRPINRPVALPHKGHEGVLGRKDLLQPRGREGIGGGWQSCSDYEQTGPAISRPIASAGVAC